jgi:sugar (pentulose or hexulose) kinase
LTPNPTSEAELYLGLDFGTSGARANLIDPNGSLVHEAALKFSRNDYAEWREALWQLLGGIPAKYRANIASIAICGTSSTSLLCDQAGEPLLPALLYNDSRASVEAKTIQRMAPTGHVCNSASSSLAKLLWFRKQPEYALARYFLHQADWLALLLHSKLGISDYHNALKLGYDVESLCYPQWLAEMVEENILPQVLEPGMAIGFIQSDVANKFGLSVKCQIRAGTTDSIAAFIASGAHRPGQAVTSLGSTIVLKLLSQKRVEAAEYGIYSHRCGALWLAGGASNCGGAVLNKLFGHERLAALSRQLKPDHPTGLDYYPLITAGERFPVNDIHLQPRLEPRPQDDLIYLQGLLESLARIEAQGYTLLENLGATPVWSVLTAGGGASNTVWTAIRSRIMAIQVGTAEHTEAAYGVAKLARNGVKSFDSFVMNERR